MKILSCHIENFGKISNMDINFDTKLHVVNENNGWGKTTLASFIMCMFYGVPSNRGKDTVGNERKQYMPWNGSKFGGNIIFEVKGASYRIERFFGSAPSGDTFALYNAITNKVSRDFDENVGEKVFGINKESYERSTYIPQNSVYLDGLGGDLNAKLSGLINNTDEKHSFADAHKRLDIAKKDITTSQGKGKLDAVSTAIIDINTKITECDTYASRIDEHRLSLGALNSRLSENKDSLAILEKKIQVKNTENEIAAKAGLYATLQTQKESILKEQETLESFFNGKNPLEVDIESIKALMKRVDSLEDEIRKLEKALIDLEHDRVIAAANKQRQIESLNYAKSDKESLEKNTRLLQDKLDGLTKRQSASSMPAEKIVQQSAPKQNKTKLIVLIAISCALLIGGIAACFVILYLGIALIAVGVVGLIATALIWMKGYIDSKATTQLVVAPSYHTEDNAIIQQDIDKTNTDIRQNLKKIEDAAQKVVDIIADIDTTQDFDVAAIEEQKTKLDGKREELSQCDAAVENLLTSFHLGDSEWGSCVARIETNVARYKKNTEELKEVSDKIADFIKDKKASDYTLSCAMGETIHELTADKFKINTVINDINKSILRTQTEIDRLENLIADKDSLVSELELDKEKRAELRVKLDIIQQTDKYLTEAKDILASRYLQPLVKNSQKYINLLSGDTLKLKFDADTKILLEDGGEQHTLDVYSAGYKELISICARFALIETIFTGEKPTVILDDPFVNLDKDKLDNAKKLINDLSNTYQIIYFTCHESRALQSNV